MGAFETSGVAWAAGAALGAATGRALRRRGVGLDQALRRARHLYAVAALPALAVAAHFALQSTPGVWWALPPWIEARYMTLLWCLVALPVADLCSASVTLAYAERHRERHKLALAALLVLAAIEVPCWCLTRPVELQERTTADGIVLQSSEVTCAAASAANLLRLAGRGPATEREMADALGTTVFGTTTGQVVEGLASLGVECRKVAVADIADLAAPAMLFVDIEGVPEGHAVAYAGLDAGRVELWDPLEGRRRVSESTLNGFWHGHAVECPGLRR